MEKNSNSFVLFTINSDTGIVDLNIKNMTKLALVSLADVLIHGVKVMIEDNEEVVTRNFTFSAGNSVATTDAAQ